MTKRKSKKKYQIRIEATAAMLLLVVLAALTMLLISSTGKSYKGIVKTGGDSQNIRTALLFVATKVRQADNGKNIKVVSAPWGNRALVITQHNGSSVNKDWIFYYKGTIRETMVPSGTEINPPACQIISNLNSFSLSLCGNRLDVTAGKAAISQNLTLTLRNDGT